MTLISKTQTCALSLPSRIARAKRGKHLKQVPTTLTSRRQRRAKPVQNRGSTRGAKQRRRQVRCDRAVRADFCVAAAADDCASTIKSRLVAMTSVPTIARAARRRRDRTDSNRDTDQLRYLHSPQKQQSAMTSLLMHPMLLLTMESVRAEPTDATALRPPSASRRANQESKQLHRRCHRTLYHSHVRQSLSDERTERAARLVKLVLSLCRYAVS